MDVDPQLLLLRRQYLQLFEPDFLAWPSPKLLKNVDAQKWLHRHLFDTNRNPHLPPESYQLRVLKQLTSKMGKGKANLDSDGVLGELAACLTSLIAKKVSSEIKVFQENAYVTFTCIPEKRNDYEDTSEPTLTLLEKRQLVSGSQITGFRTWEGSLHLGSYLLTEAGSHFVNGKNILELGTGTGFNAILAGKHLHANHVTATDGDGGVIEALRENLTLNKIDDQQQVRARTLLWGQDLKGTWVEDGCRAHPYDIVLGADITYEKSAISALVLTLQSLFDMRPKLQVIISGVVRNAETFQTFRDQCASHHFVVEDIQFEAKPMRQQKSLFYAAAVPLKLLSITRP
ncbi:putative methyltransferase-domain-containing protein [Hypoxylon trugodes]|uniref:putative methyltransferase-domain-containing protein n=1 Tax=Hypoxylon trugodes TaxID=326681 RepID=UPI0021964D7D|nr:putative methyltransferase-domain-containing protein [Hypoxylon trugodes]KAI1382836.1 putative methyltransferase-domain-containing protein [Hypoxylon trugodes]